MLYVVCRGSRVYLHFLYIDKIMGNGGKGLINKSCRTGVVVAKIFAVSRPVAEFSNVLRGPATGQQKAWTEYL